MKAIIAVIDDDGKIREKDKVIMPYDVVINPEDMIPTKTTYFRFGITECLYNKHISEKENE